MFHLIKKFNKKTIGDSALFLERIMAFIVFVAIIAAILSLWEPFLEFWQHRNEGDAFFKFIGSVFSIVIVIEFFRLLCEPTKSTLLEVLMFVVARHLIIEETSPMENLISIITIAILFVIDRFLLAEPEFHHPHLSEDSQHISSDSTEETGAAQHIFSDSTEEAAAARHISSDSTEEAAAARHISSDNTD